MLQVGQRFAARTECRRLELQEPAIYPNNPLRAWSIRAARGSQPSLVGTKVRSARRTWFDADFVKLLPILFDAIA